MSSDQLVSVVIPAYNAEMTLDETLHSVCGQTHGNMEIIIVDDGSTDSTRALAERHAAVDPRIQVLYQRNEGVAAARNIGWQQARSEFIAFADADDLWAPTKIERQLQALQAAGPRAGLAYAWTARIDEFGVVKSSHGGILYEGDVLSIILRSNFLCCGSNVLVRREALIEAEGFDPRLRAAGYEGCEDWLLHCRIAETYHFVGVPEYLVGYRDFHKGMSRNRLRMLGSHLLVCRQIIARRPDLAGATLCGLRNYCAWLLREAVQVRRPREAWSLWWMMWNEHPAGAWHVLWRELLMDPVRLVRDQLRRATGWTGSEPALPLGRRFLTIPQFIDR